MFKKILVGFVGTLALAALVLVPAAQAQMSTTTLGTSIDTISDTTYDYFGVLLAKLWPFVVGFVILIGVWYLGRRFIHSFR